MKSINELVRERAELDLCKEICKECLDIKVHSLNVADFATNLTFERVVEALHTEPTTKDRHDNEWPEDWAQWLKANREKILNGDGQ